MKLVFHARPSYGPFEPEADFAAARAVKDHELYTAHVCAFRCSMTSKNMNDHLAECLNSPNLYHYLAWQHADVSPGDGWIDTSVEDMEANDWDVIHAPCRIKNFSEQTSTGVVYSDGRVVRLTTGDLEKLPRTFDVDTIKALIDPAVDRMLVNTGCCVWRLGPWIAEFPGFTMYDEMYHRDGKWQTYCVSEDYMFSDWCNQNGIRQGATQIPTTHWGRWGFVCKGKEVEAVCQ